MYIVQVYVKVKEKDIPLFIKETIENASQSLNENGVIRFDVQQSLEYPQQFLLTEIYVDSGAPLEHKKTTHYKKWKNAVEKMMEEPRNSVKYRNIFPEN
ncbi:MAG: putative quinol monooxygenase [Pelolinea sp.]|nr:putative quinol monooxygenase [Pelolinea sp.]